ncbi:MAG: hypothetical protein AAF307_09300 [Pseudomonadota bacterium]
MRALTRGVASVMAMAGMAAIAQADTWQRLSGAEISATLTGITLDYDARWQDFRASGRTLYFSGADSWGFWDVRGDQYCSMWPPSDLWACYDIQRQGDVIRFIGAAGDVTDGRIRAAD